MPADALKQADALFARRQDVAAGVRATRIRLTRSGFAPSAGRHAAGYARAMLLRALHALRVTVDRHGLAGTARRVPKFVRFLSDRVAQRAYYRAYWAREHAEGFDAQLGTDTSGMVEAFELDLGGPNARHAVRYEPAHVSDVFRALAALPGDPGDFSLVDLGCGKGRALLVAASLGFKKAIGVELSGTLLDVARRNVERFKAAGYRGDFELQRGDAATFEPPDGDVVYYLFNPFGAAVLQVVVDRLVESLRLRPRRAAIAYVFPAHRDVIERSGAWRPAHQDPRFTVFTNW